MTATIPIVEIVHFVFVILMAFWAGRAVEDNDYGTATFIALLLIGMNSL